MSNILPIDGGCCWRHNRGVTLRHGILLLVGIALLQLGYTPSAGALQYASPKFLTKYLTKTPPKEPPAYPSQPSPVPASSSSKKKPPIPEPAAIPSDFPPITIISTKNYPQVLGQVGEPFNLTQTTITYVPMNNYSYAWKRGPLVWHDDYDGDEPVAVPLNDVDFNAPPIPLPFAFPFFGIKQTQLYLSARIQLQFPKGVQDAKPCQPETLIDCAPRIFGTGRALGEGHIFVKKSAEEILVTYLSDPDPNIPWIDKAVQFSLKKDGLIRVSYKTMQNPLMYDFYLGLYSGDAGSIQGSPLNDPQVTEGGGKSSSVVSLIYHAKGAAVQPESLHNIIYDKLPSATYDAVIIVSDFAYATLGNVAGALVGSMGAVTRMHYNDVLGIGYPVDCYEDNCAKWSQMRAFIHLKNIRAASPNVLPVKGNAFHQTLLHEFGHKWMSFLDLQNGSCEGQYANSQCHWINGYAAAYDATDVSAMYLGKFLKGYGYAPIDLYLMGLAAPETVPSEEGLTIADVIAKVGPRVPSYQTSQKTFRVGVVLLTERDVGTAGGDTEMLKMVRGYMNAFAAHFTKATLGLGKIVF